MIRKSRSPAKGYITVFLVTSVFLITLVNAQGQSFELDATGARNSVGSSVDRVGSTFAGTINIQKKTDESDSIIDVELPDTSVISGETIWIPVTCSNISEEDSVLSYQMIINYDPEIGYIDSAKIEGSITPDHFTSIWNFTQPGIVNGGYLNFSNLEGITGSGVLCYLRFTGDNTNGGVTALEFEACVFNGGEPSSSMYDGSVTVQGVGISGPEVGLMPSEFKFYPIYPNPFNNEVTIDFSLPGNGAVDVSVYDINGKLAANLFSGILPGGDHSRCFKLEHCASGIYFFRLQVGEFSSVQKAVYVK